jgi:hypothetical protein
MHFSKQTLAASGLSDSNSDSTSKKGLLYMVISLLLGKNPPCLNLFQYTVLINFIGEKNIGGWGLARYQLDYVYTLQ